MTTTDAPRVFPLAELLEDPRLLLFGIDLAKMELRFVDATRRTYEASAFLAPGARGLPISWTWGAPPT